MLIELVSLDESKAIRGLRKASRAEMSPGVWVESVALSPEAENAHEAPATELIRVGEKLEERDDPACLEIPRLRDWVAVLSHPIL